ncbi:hypothetical protein YP516_4186 [Yersinia pestis Nepal516]|nr:hypothetical protein YP516_4186 [Yersinia pestis Nepal516]
MPYKHWPFIKIIKPISDMLISKYLLFCGTRQR